MDAGSAAAGFAGEAETFGDGGAGNVGVEDCDVVVSLHEAYCEEGCDEGFADATFAAHDGDDLFDAALWV